MNAEKNVGREPVSEQDDQDKQEAVGQIQSGSQRPGENSYQINHGHSGGNTPSCASDTIRANLGGILSRVKELQDEHLAYVKSHEDRLETRLSENRRHQNRILEKMKQLEAEIESLIEPDISDGK